MVLTLGLAIVFLVLIVGAGVYVIAKDGSVKEIGRAMLWTALLVLLFALAEGRVFR